MDYTQQIAAYNTLVNQLVGSKIAEDSIDPGDVAAIGIQLADLLLPILNTINDFAITGGTLPPNNANGVDLDLYIQGGASLTFWRRRNGVWIAEASVDLGIQIIDGPISLQASVNLFVATVSPGSWAINNIIYSKAVQTQMNLTAANLNFDRIDSIIANSAGVISLLNGVASSNPAPTVKPANSIVVAYVYVPASSTGDLPYIADSNTPSAPTFNINNIKSQIPTPGGVLSITWQTDIIPGDTVTYAEKHGNSIGSIEAFFEDGSFNRTSYKPNYSYTYNGGGNILIVTFTDLFPGIITLI